MIALTDQERGYVAELLERRFQELMHELHHTVSRRFKDGLREEMDVVEHLLLTIAPEHAWTTGKPVEAQHI